MEAHSDDAMYKSSCSWQVSFFLLVSSSIDVAIERSLANCCTAWMIAAFLPLPYNPMAEMREHEADNSSSQLDTSNQNATNYDRRFGPIDEKRFENAKWWRNLNRWMSVVGFLIIAAIVSCLSLDS
jgi:hypothetical protein